MDFREEYKKQAEVMTPSAEAMERMTKNIMEQINAPVKKAIPFKKIAYIGGSVAACAVIAVGIIRLAPRMDNTLETAAEDCAAASPSATYIAQDSDTASEAEIAYSVQGDSANYDDGTAMECAQDNADSVFDYFADAAENVDSPAAGAATVTESEKSITADDAEAAEDEDIIADYTSEDTFICETSDVTDAVRNELPTLNDTSEAHAKDVFLSEEDMTFEISADTWTIYVDGIQFDYIDDGSVNMFTDGIRTKLLTAPDGTEYQLDFYHDEYLVLIKDGEMIGGYARIM